MVIGQDPDPPIPPSLSPSCSQGAEASAACGGPARAAGGDQGAPTMGTCRMAHRGRVQGSVRIRVFGVWGVGLHRSLAAGLAPGGTAEPSEATSPGVQRNELDCPDLRSANCKPVTMVTSNRTPVPVLRPERSRSGWGAGGTFGNPRSAAPSLARGYGTSPKGRAFGGPGGGVRPTGVPHHRPRPRAGRAPPGRHPQPFGPHPHRGSSIGGGEDAVFFFIPTRVLLQDASCRRRMCRVSNVFTAVIHGCGGILF